MAFHHRGWKSTPIATFRESVFTLLSSVWPSLGDSVDSLETRTRLSLEIVVKGCRLAGGEPSQAKIQSLLGEKDGVPQSGDPISSQSLTCL